MSAADLLHEAGLDVNSAQCRIHAIGDPPHLEPIIRKLRDVWCELYDEYLKAKNAQSEPTTTTEA